MKNEYFLGLDIGTNSIGWAVTSPDYTLAKHNGKTLWGVHLFEDAKTAEERRGFRSSRRRLERRKQRIKLLREFFKEEIDKVDPGFFERLDDSFFEIEDKTVHQKNSLFNDENYDDTAYHNEYKTIYHLREKLIKDDNKHDIRLIYLAIEHILKHRGHFLKEGSELEAGSDFENIFREWCGIIEDEFNETVSLTDTEEIKELLKSKDGVNAKKKALKNMFDSDRIRPLVELLSGAKGTLSKIFDNENYAENKTKEISFRDDKFDENRDALAQELTENEMYIIDKTKELYDWGVLADILSGNDYISEAKVKSYVKHGKDLDCLKSVIKRLVPEKYNEVFKDGNREDNYTAYVGKSKTANEKNAPKSSCTREEFGKYIEKILKEFKDDSEAAAILAEIEAGTFMPKQVSKDNSVIPYQLHLKELKAILKNASKHYEFLNDADEYGTVADKIISLLTFRIPYYVGPINTYHKKYAWSVRKDNMESEPVRAWNFDSVIDLEKSAERFIERMTNRCTYFPEEPVLAKSSVLYSKYMVFNELNNIKVNEEPLSYELKMMIYNKVFLQRSKPTVKSVTQELKNYYGNVPVEITGLAEDFKSSMKSYIDFKLILNDKINTVISEDDIDEMIRLITILSDEKAMLKKKIQDLYGDRLTEKEITSISQLKYSGWGRFSRKLLAGIYTVDKATGEMHSIIDTLESSTENFMQILFNPAYDFKTQIDAAQGEYAKVKNPDTYAYLDDLYLSSSNKRRVWKTLTLVKEIVKVMKHPPKKIFVEMARGKDEGNDKSSRKKQLEKLYQSVAKENIEGFDEVFGNLKNENDSTLRQKKLFLYYRQLGRCMYSGKILSLYDLKDCDIDHIIPQSLKKDDSLDNTVLVLKTLNAEKSNEYPVPAKVVSEAARQHWRVLRAKDFISKEKYNRLVRTTELTLEEKADFINRQLVDTRQTTKVVADILGKMYCTNDADVEIVYVKAQDVSLFRNGAYVTKAEQKQNPDLYKDDKLVKVREINDFHHAKDAYLNIVVGNIYNEKFNHNPLVFLKNFKATDNDKHGYNLARIFQTDVEKANWKAGSQGTILKVKKTLRKNNVLYTRALYEGNTIFNKIQLVKSGGGTHPIKENDERYSKVGDKKGYKYGGYPEVTGAYYALIKCTFKKKTAIILEAIPVHIATKVKADENELVKYLATQEYSNIHILIPKVMFSTLFKINGMYMTIAGRTGNKICFNNAVSLYLGDRDEKYIKKIVKYIDYAKRSGNSRDTKADVQAEDFELENDRNIELYNTLLGKLYNTIYDNEFFKTNRLKAEEAKDVFENLSVGDQAIILNEFLKLFSCNAECGHFKGTKIKGLEKINDFNRSTANKNLISKSEVKIINQSPTGIFESEVDVLELANRCDKEQSEA